MYLDPTALMLADRGQRRLVESVRFDDPLGRDRRLVRTRRARRLAATRAAAAD
jgi:hypothetical protein